MKKLWLVLFAALAGVAHAQVFPSGPVRIVVPYSPGGGVDGMARPLADRVAKLWGQTVLVDNRPGGVTNIGAGLVAKADPDGQTLLLTPCGDRSPGRPDRSKITGYLLSLSHPDDRTKAAFFMRFGFSAERWEELAEAPRW
jgi:tripartite-type tricarboxylate transporter receptor subunit TctC